MITIPGLNTYFGGKGRDGVYQNIINLQPKHAMYVEPFLGSGAILCRKAPAKVNVGIEINPKIFGLWSHALIQHVHANPEKWETVAGKIDSLDLTVIHGDAISWLEQNLDRISLNGIPAGDILLYLDPPYPNTTRKSNHKYAYDLADTEHEDILKIITRLHFKIQISIYDNALYNRYLKSWHRHEFITYDRRHNKCVEVLYFNYPVPEELHTWQYAGNDYRQRENIKRKVKRFVAKFKKMPVLERNAILQEINKI